MTCPKCGSDNVNIQAVAENKKRGILMSILWVLLAICTFGLILLIPILTRKGSKIRTWAICQSCGYRWKPSVQKPNQAKSTSKTPVTEPLISSVHKALRMHLDQEIEITEDINAWTVTKEGLSYTLNSNINIGGADKDAHIKIYFPDDTYNNFFFSKIQIGGEDMLR